MIVPDETQAYAEIVGEYPNQKLNLHLPRGDRGEKGDKGDKGDTGDIGASTTLTVLETTTGVDYQYPGPQGPKGDKGDAGGWVSGTDLLNNDLNNIVTPGLYRQPTFGNATLVLNYPIASTSGVLEVTDILGATNILQRYTTFGGTANGGGRIIFERRNNGGTWDAWRAYYSNRIDNTAGRAIYQWNDTNGAEQLIYGDTGWRDVTTAVGAVGGSIYLRRIGAVVYLVSNGASFSVTQDVPGFTGFRSALSLYSPPTDVAALSGAPRRVLILNAAGWRIFDTMQMNFSMSYPTNDAWPTVLPGVASGTIPNL